MQVDAAGGGVGFRTADWYGGRWLIAEPGREGLARRAVRRVLMQAFDTAVRLSHQVEVTGLEHYSRTRPTLIVASHRRDTDGPLLGSALIDRRGRRPVGPLPHFVAREDLFRRGFLREYLTGWPRPLRELLGVINVAPVLELLHAHPMRRIPERSLWETLEDVRAVCGDLPITEVLRPRWVEEVRRLAPRGAAGLKVSDVLKRRYRPVLRLRYGLSKLTRECFRAIKPHERQVIEAQLGRFVALLDRGESVQLEPEGTVSTDGSFHRIRNGLYTLLARAKRPPPVLPVGITYDFICSGCTRVFVNVGPELTGLEALPRREVNARVARAIRALTTVTVSQLATRHLLEAVGPAGGGSVTAAELEACVAEQALRWRRRGLQVDPRAFDERERRRRVHGYLQYCVRHGALVRRRGDVFVAGAGSRRGHGGPGEAHFLRYAHNEFDGIARCTAGAASS